MTHAELVAWNQAEKLVITAHYGFVFSEPNDNAQTVSDCVAGNRFKLLGKKGRYYKVGYPDGREGYVAKAIALPEKQWKMTLELVLFSLTMESTAEARSGEYLADSQKSHGHSLSLGWNLLKRSGLQWIGTYDPLHARYTDSSRRLATSYSRGAH